MISYADERSFKENKWKQEYITRQAAINSAQHLKDYYEYIVGDEEYDENNNNDDEEDQIVNRELKMQAQIRKLKLETVYYFKIQERNSREYLAQSKIILFKTPNVNGKGAKIVNYKKISKNKDLLIKEDPISKYHLDINFVWITVSSIIAILVIILLLVTILLCKRSSSTSSTNKKIYQEQEQQQQQQNLLINKQQQQQHNYETTTNSTSVSPNNLNVDLNSNPSQKLLINTTATWLNNSTSNGVITSISGVDSFISGSNHSSSYGQNNNNSVIMSTLNEQKYHQNTLSSSIGSTSRTFFTIKNISTC